jgi:uncharacterized Zn finger protein (UPF0148 family)
MHQRLTCPGCGTQITAEQQFCGICGTKLSGVAQKQDTMCPGCGSPIAAGQSFCGICGTRLAEMEADRTQAQPAADIMYGKSEVPPVEMKTPPLITQVPPASAKERATITGAAQAAIPPSAVNQAPAMYESQPAEQEMAFANRSEPMMSKTEPSRRKYHVLRVAAVIFQIFGWIVLVGGILASIAMAVFAGIGGSFITIFGGQSLAGMTAISIALGGIVISLLYGFALLAFAAICNAIVDIVHYLR